MLIDNILENYRQMSIKKSIHAYIILDKIVTTYNLKGYPGLAEFLGIKYQTLMAWKKRGRIGDYAVFLDKCPGLRLEWLKTGEGEMLEGEAAPPSVAESAPVYDTLDALDVAFLRDWRALSEVEQMRIWTLMKEAKHRADEEKKRRGGES